MSKKNDRVTDFKYSMNEFLSRPGNEIAGFSLAVTNSEKTIFEGAWGHRRFDYSRNKSFPMLVGSYCRIASISKTFTSLLTMIIADRGLIDIEENLSEYLPWKLQNPHFPQKSICAVDILTHCSGLRDGTDYNLPQGENIASIVTGQGSIKNWDSSHEPGRYFSYCNLGYGVLATALEYVTGTPFYRLIEEHLLKPARLEGNFNPYRLTDEEVSSMATLYRKNGSTDLWIAQTDDFKGVQPVDSKDYLKYLPGTNGTLFAPHGGFRTSVVTLTKMIRLLLNKGKQSGEQIVPEKAVSMMMNPRWHSGKDHSGEFNGDSGNRHSRISGLGLFNISNEQDEFGGDSMLPHGGPRCWYHHGEAWGLVGAMVFDPEADLGFAYLITGTASDSEEKTGKWSCNSVFEEELQAQIVEAFWP